MQANATELALRWRLETREAFSKYFGLGYRAVGFELDRETGGGEYVLARRP
jgi:predicted GNAT superfamily acetyltransferase